MSESKPMSIPEVKKLLKRNKKKAVLQTIENCLIVLRNDATLQGAIRQNILTDRQDIVKDVGWVRSSTTITDTDYQYIMHYLEHHYSLSVEKRSRLPSKSSPMRTSSIPYGIICLLYGGMGRNGCPMC